MNFPILSSVIFLPLLGAFFIFLSRSQNNNQSADQNDGYDTGQNATQKAS